MAVKATTIVPRGISAPVSWFLTEKAIITAAFTATATVNIAFFVLFFSSDFLIASEKTNWAATEAAKSRKCSGCARAKNRTETAISVQFL